MDEIHGMEKFTWTSSAVLGDSEPFCVQDKACPWQAQAKMLDLVESAAFLLSISEKATASAEVFDCRPLLAVVVW